MHLAALPTHIQRLTITISMGVDTGLTCSHTHASLYFDCASGAAWTFQPPSDPGIRVMVIAELYRHTTNGQPTGKLRAVGQGWADGLARAHGVHVE